MKFIVLLKDPDALYDAIEEAVENEINKIEGLSEEDKDSIKEGRIEKLRDICSQWFEYGEYLRVEIDTQAKTCIVLKSKK